MDTDAVRDVQAVTVKDIIARIFGGWDSIVVRVKQDGEMRFMTLGQVKNQRLVYKIVKDLLKQGVKESGIL